MGVRSILRFYQLIFIVGALPLPTKCWTRRRRIFVERVNAYYLVVCARSQVFAVGREADRMDGAGVVADSRELLRLRIRGVVGIQNGLGRPDTYITVCRCVLAIS